MIKAYRLVFLSLLFFLSISIEAKDIKKQIDSCEWNKKCLLELVKDIDHKVSFKHINEAAIIISGLLIASPMFLNIEKNAPKSLLSIEICPVIGVLSVIGLSTYFYEKKIQALVENKKLVLDKLYINQRQ